MLQHQQPLFIERLLENPPLRLERNQRLYVVAHDPWEREMGVGGNQIAQI